MPLSSGQILNNRYRIVKLLGQGGFGAVYRAWDLTLERSCAVKENLETNPSAQSQFEREAKLLAKLRHPNLPQIFDHFFVSGQGQYLVMEFIEGEDLETKVNQAKPGVVQSLTEKDVLPWILQVCDALTYLHTRTPPVIHRDIKPANIKITPEGQAMLVDFGIAKQYDPTQKTYSGARAATPGFSPIEQYKQTGTDARSDIYSLGATMYFTLTGQRPPESIDLLTGTALVHPRQLNPAISPSVEAVVLKAMETLPGQRFQSAREFVNALRPAPAPPPTITVPQASGASYAGSGVAVRQPAAPPARGNRPVAYWLAGGLIALVLGVVYLLFANANGFWPFTVATTTTPTRESMASPTAVFPTLTSIPSRMPTFTAPAVLPTVLQATPTVTVQPTSSTEPPADAQLGDTWTRPADGMVMHFIPPGEFLMGSADSDSVAFSDEKPQHTVTLDAYWIDQTEATNAMFELFIQQTGHQTTAEQAGSGYVFNTSTKSWKDTQGADWRRPRGPSSSLEGLGDHPVVQVSWDDATAYCAWAGGRLPTEAEWEKAASWDARQQVKYKYPWGDGAPAGELLNFADVNLDVNSADRSIDDGYQFTAPVGSYPAGASPYGLLDMAGNVWEWVQDWYSDTYYASSPASNPLGPSSGDGRALRGGAWDFESWYVRTAVRIWNVPDVRYDDYGFRCVR